MRHLEGLNDEQMRSVTASVTGQLQVVAGPGTGELYLFSGYVRDEMSWTNNNKGKTKLLTARVAHLLLTQDVKPHQLIVTTFTRKAANEMKSRLEELLEGSSIQINKLKMGTFHSICIRLLRRHANDVGISERFTVANNKDMNDITDAVIDSLRDELDAMEEKTDALRDDKNDLSNSQIRKYISHLKSKALDVHAYEDFKEHKSDLLSLYKEYDHRMKQQCMLDFDDILLLCLKLLRTKQCLFGIKHVLIDEFQDTNTVQLELMREFARQNPNARDNITVVGDVDQSIYAFRGAMAENFVLMRKEYPQCEVVQLRENYRSTQDILDISELIMRDQRDREGKALASQHALSFKAVFKQCASDILEAQFMVKEIKHLLTLKLFTENDICILVRSNFLTRVIERELRSARLNYCVLKGRAFWERREVITMIDLLRTTARADDMCAVLRLLGSQGGIGDASVKKIRKLMEESYGRLKPVQVLQGIVDYDLKVDRFQTRALEVCGSILEVLKKAKQLYNHDVDDRDTILVLFDYLNQTAVIQQVVADDEDKIANVLEIRRHFKAFIPEIEEGGGPEITLLEHFLNSIDIYSPEEVTVANEAAPTPIQQPQVMVSTVHSAKGLEWPIVFVAGLTQGKFPSSKVDELVGDTAKMLDEERRILYVAMTRARQLLYLTSAFEPSRLVQSFDSSDKVTKKQIALSSAKALGSLAHHNSVVLGDMDECVRRYRSLHSTDHAQGLFFTRGRAEQVGFQLRTEHRVKFTTAPQTEKVPEGFSLGKKATAPKKQPHTPEQAPKPAAKVPMAPLDTNTQLEPPKRRKTLGMRRRRA